MESVERSPLSHAVSAHRVGETGRPMGGGFSTEVAEEDRGGTRPRVIPGRSCTDWKDRRPMNAANINVIRVGQKEVTMPASATVEQRRFVRGWLSGLDSEGASADIVAEKCGMDREIRVSFLAGDGQRQQMVIAPEGGGSYAEGAYLGDFAGRS
ncbi:hypothetical protein [Amycolatopsis sp. RTGN1]|uniref:hypothetical protein n=1 Tax=Amycolatopsis ponsaeliensis TaxID=2992142 RepID=UPI00254EA1C1|nr:hypothetical protein [Amycolatopsis sp. RTGN1]